jgi:hypothetical protein
MAIESVRRHANLSEAQFRATIRFVQVECRDGIVVGPPVLGPPGLDNFPTWLQHQIEPGNVVSPRLERAPYLSADARLLSRQRFVLLGVHDHLVDILWRSLEGHSLPDGRGVAQPQHSEPDRPPFVRIPLGQFIGTRLALQRGDLTLAGRWLQSCTGQGCTHEYCGSREVSFDWSTKRGRGLLLGDTVDHLPVIGDVRDRSTSYDPNLLTEIEQRDRDFEAMPDYVEYIEK